MSKAQSWTNRKESKCADCGKPVVNTSIRCPNCRDAYAKRQFWVARTLANQKPAPEGAVFESVEEYIARGGQVRRIVIEAPPPKMGSLVGYKSGVRRQGWAA